MDTRPAEGKFDVARSDPSRWAIRGALEPGPTGAHCCCCAGDCCADQRVSQGTELSGWSVQSELQSRESDTPLSPDVLAHLTDELVPVEKSITDQLIENATVKISGFPIPNKIEINGHVEF